MKNSKLFVACLLFTCFSYSLFAQSSNTYVGALSNYNLIFETNNLPHMTILANGNIGIGTSSPNYPLQITGNVVDSGSILATNIAASNSFSVGSTSSPAAFNTSAITINGSTGSLYSPSGTIGFGSSSNTVALSITSPLNPCSGPVVFNSCYGYVFENSPSSLLTRVGIGIATEPGAALEVMGNGSTLPGILVDAGNVIVSSGAVVIGSGLSTPGNYGLYVGNGVLTSIVKIAFPSDPVNWSDYVFANNYKLKPLTEVAQYIKDNKHLPDVPSAVDVQKSGIDVAEMDAILLKKIEELTLYMIQQQKLSEEQQIQVEQQKKAIEQQKEIEDLKAQLETMKKNQK